MNPIVRFHRFLVGHLFYPLVLCTILAFVMYLGQAVISRSLGDYANMPWNLFLAWMPYWFSLAAAGLHRLAPRQWWLQGPLFAGWLVFFPNAPYMITDFYHLGENVHVPLWYDMISLATFAWTGCFLAIVSLWTMQRLIKFYLGGVVSWMFAALALSLSGLGIYLGRFERWNSWDLLYHPKPILKDLLAPLLNPGSNLRFFGFTLLFTAFLVVVYLTFIAIRHTSDDSKPERG